MLRCLFLFLQSAWTPGQLRSEKETRNKLIEADMNGKPQSGVFMKYVSLSFFEEQNKVAHKKRAAPVNCQLLLKGLLLFVPVS